MATFGAFGDFCAFGAFSAFCDFPADLSDLSCLPAESESDEVAPVALVPGSDVVVSFCAGFVVSTLAGSADTGSAAGVDASTFTITMKEASDLAVRALAKPSGVAPFMMPKRIAETPPTQAITTAIGSGPFKFVAYQKDAVIRYAKNADYWGGHRAEDNLAEEKAVELQSPVESQR